MYPQVDLKLAKQLRMNLKLLHHLLHFLGAGIIAMCYQAWFKLHQGVGMEAWAFFFFNARQEF